MFSSTHQPINEDKQINKWNSNLFEWNLLIAGRLHWWLLGGLWAGPAPLPRTNSTPTNHSILCLRFMLLAFIFEKLKRRLARPISFKQIKQIDEMKLNLFNEMESIVAFVWGWFVVGYGAEPICAAGLHSIHLTNEFHFTCFASSIIN